eukprot:357935-Chlamydomonas_euryale.AAC.2
MSITRVSVAAIEPAPPPPPPVPVPILPTGPHLWLVPPRVRTFGSSSFSVRLSDTTPALRSEASAGVLGGKTLNKSCAGRFRSAEAVGVLGRGRSAGALGGRMREICTGLKGQHGGKVTRERTIEAHDQGQGEEKIVSLDARCLPMPASA